MSNGIFKFVEINMKHLLYTLLKEIELPYITKSKTHFENKSYKREEAPLDLPPVQLDNMQSKASIVIKSRSSVTILACS